MFLMKLPYLAPILVAAAIAAGTAYHAWRKRPAAGAAPMVALSISVAIWSLFYALELSSSRPAEALFAVRLQYVGIVTAPVAWLWLALEYSGRDERVTARNLALLALLPAITLLITWAEPALVWAENDITRWGELTFFTPPHGPWFWVHSAYSYLLLLTGSAMYLTGAIRAPRLYRWQARAFLASVLLPWVANGAYLFGLTRLDLTPFALALSTVLLAWAIFQVRLLDLMPLAREAVVESMNDPIIVLDQGNRIVDANPASRLLTGRAPSELVGQAADTVAPLAGLLSGGDGADPARQVVAVERDGRQRFYRVGPTPVRGRSGRRRGTLFLFHDITENRRADEALRSEKAFTEAIINALPGVFYLLDEQGRLLRSNENLEQVTGRSAEELARINPFDMVAEEDRARAHEQFAEAFRQGSTKAEISFVTATGEKHPYLFTGRRVVLGGRRHLVGMGLDIGERKQRERELESFVTVARALRAADRRERMLPVILDEAIRLLPAEGAMLVTHPGPERKRIELARGAWQSLSGRELAAGPVVESFGPATPGSFFLLEDVRALPHWPHPEWIAPFFAVVGAPLLQNHHILGVVWLGGRSPFTESAGRSLAAIAEIAASALSRALVLETVEKRVRERTEALNDANVRLRGLDRIRSKMIDDVAHELRTPVTTIGLYLDLLAHSDPSEQAHYLPVLRAQSKRLNSIVESVLRYSELEARAAEEALEMIDLNQIAQAVVEAHHSVAAARDLQLALDLHEPLPPVRGIRTILRHAVTHVVDNALKYTTAGTITVSTRCDEQGERIGLQVRDPGMGISEEEIPHVFDRFFRGQAVGQSTTPGSGLGLSMVREIVRAHDGEIEIESEVDRGTTVRLWLPRAGMKAPGP